MAPSSQKYAERLSELGHEGFVYPLDDALGLSRLPFKMTLSVMLAIARESIRCESYEDAQQLLKKNFNIQTNDDTMRKVTNCIGTLVFKNDLKIAEAMNQKLTSGSLIFPAKKKNNTLYLEVNSAIVPTRDKDVKGIVYKESKLGIVFSTDNIIWLKNLHNKSYYRIEKCEYMPLIDDSQEFSKLFFSTALRNGYGIYKKTVLLSDGSAWIRTMRDRYFPDAQQILDFFYLKERINDLAMLIFNNNEDKYKIWAKEISYLFEKRKYNEAIKQIIKSISTKSKEMIVNFVKYININKSNIDYSNYLENGLFIGSSAIESANKIATKTVLQRRMKKGVKRWNVESGQAVVTLVAKIRSGLWLADVVKSAYSEYGEPFNGL
jgi:hypothetical protein